ncbi:hypothetical protein EV702DRAFT_1200473 [Suillus placidus]|uniref:C2H2-type domain-containing protein n=1 Tax=Suillus placidus TaxID=48579 RepID=A0A9P7CZR8_9AGAM|nr:hypothetical protein EV702DRAFT_1200473 [Suillus placidus]
MNLSPRGATTASQFHENIHPPYHGPSGMPWEHATAILGTGSSGLESVPRDLNSHAALRVHYPLLPPELPSTIQPTFLPSVSSSSNIVAPLGDQPDLLGVGAHGHQIQQPGGPRAYMVDGLWVDEEYLMDGHGRYINVHACGREHSPCSLWVKADRRSIMRHGQRWHRDARGSDGDRKITCPWSGCDSQMRASAVPRHTLSAHFGAMWTCTGCSKSFTRHDSFTAHSRKCDNLGATVKYDASTRVIDTTNVLRHYN